MGNVFILLYVTFAVLYKGAPLKGSCRRDAKETVQSADTRTEDKLKVLMRGSDSLNLRFANMQSTLQVQYLL